MNRFKRFVDKVTPKLEGEDDTFFYLLGLATVGAIPVVVFFTVMFDPDYTGSLRSGPLFCVSMVWAMASVFLPWVLALMSGVVCWYLRWVSDGDLCGNGEIAKWMRFTKFYPAQREVRYGRPHLSSTSHSVLLPIDHAICVWSIFFLGVGAIAFIAFMFPVISFTVGTAVGGSFLLRFTHRLSKRLKSHVADPDAHNKGEK